MRRPIVDGLDRTVRWQRALAAAVAFACLAAPRIAFARPPGATCESSGRGFIAIATPAETPDESLDWQDIVKHVRSELLARDVGLCASQESTTTATPLGELSLSSETASTLRITLRLRNQGDAPAERVLELSSVPPDARSLAIAVATDELLAANWGEIERRADAATPPPSRPSPPGTRPTPPVPEPRLFISCPVFVFESFGGGQDLLGLDARAAWQFVPRLSLTLRAGIRQGLPQKSAHGSIHSSALLGGLGLRIDLARWGRTHLDLFGRADAVDLRATAYPSPGALSHDERGLAIVAEGGVSLRSYLSRKLSVSGEAGAGGVPRPVHLTDAGQRVSGVADWAVALGGGIDVAF